MSRTSKGSLNPAPQLRALQWWSAAQLASLCLKLNPVLQAWAARWDMPVGPATAFNAHEAEGVPSELGRWKACGQRQASVEPGCWMAVGSADMLGALATAMYGEPDDGLSASAAGASLAHEVAAKALDELEDDVAKQLPAADGAAVYVAEAAPRASRAWSGNVLVRVPWCGTELWLQLDARRVTPLLDAKRRKWSGVTTPLEHPVLSVIASQTVTLRVELQPVELDLGTLQSLRLGDVLTLPHPLDMPLNVLSSDTRGCENRLLCNGYLGARQGKRAIELAQAANP